MAYDVVYARAAERDKEQIIAYLLVRQQNRRAAERLLDGLDGVVANLSRMPEMYPRVAAGRAAEGGYRKATLLSYVVLYRIEGTTVEVARIFHAKQDYARLL